LLAKSTPLNINLGSDRFSMFNNERDISRVCGAPDRELELRRLEVELAKQHRLADKQQRPPVAHPER
jgi:hypothetical protein